MNEFHFTRTWRSGLSLLAAAALIAFAPIQAGAGEPKDNPEQPSEAWLDIRDELFGQREIDSAGGAISIEAPYRAHDAATVPIRIKVTPPAGAGAKRLYIVVDENPAPVAAEFEIGPRLGASFTLSTRVRVNAYSNVRAVIETADGALYQSARFVKASGGCSAPALKDMDEAVASMGKMKMRFFEPGALRALEPGRAEAQIMMRHPNYSGFQLNQATNLYIPANFMEKIEVKQGEDLVFRASGGISLSEDPSIRFTFAPGDAHTLSVIAEDTEGHSFAGEYRIEPQS